MSDTSTIVTPADRRTVSAMSRRLSSALGERKIRIKHQVAQHLIARTCGFDNAHALFAAIGAASATARQPAPEPGPLVLRLLMERHTCAFSIDTMEAENPEGIEIVTSARQMAETGAGLIRLYILDTEEQAREFDRRLEDGRKRDGVLAYPVTIDGVHMVLAEWTEEEWEGDHPGDAVEIYDDRRFSAHRPVLFSFAPPDAAPRPVILADDSNTGEDIDITDHVLSLDADGIRALVTRWEDTYVESGYGWPFDAMPDAIAQTLRRGGYARLGFAGAIAEAFGIDFAEQISDADVARVASPDAVLRRLVRLAGVQAGRLTLDRTGPNAIRVVIEGQDGRLITATFNRDGTVRTDGGFPEVGGPKRLFASLDRYLSRKSPHPGSGHYARVIDAGLTGAGGA